MNKEILSYIKKGEIIAIIPARSGSKGIPNKNIYSLAGYPLISYSIIASRLSKKINRVIVSTDSGNYADIAKEYGAEVPFLRPADISGDKATDYTFIEHLIQWLFDNEGFVPEIIVHVRPTNPLRDPIIMDEAIDRLLANPNATSLRSGHEALHTPYKWFKKSNDGKYFQSLFDGFTNDEINSYRQGFIKAYEPDGYVDVLKTEFIIKTGLIHGNFMMSFETPAGYDIDTVDDIEFIDFRLRQESHPLLDYLHDKYPDLEGA